MPNGVSARAEDRASGWCQVVAGSDLNELEHFVNEGVNEAFNVVRTAATAARVLTARPGPPDKLSEKSPSNSHRRRETRTARRCRRGRAPCRRCPILIKGGAAAGGQLVDQRLLSRISEGEVRVLMAGDTCQMIIHKKPEGGLSAVGGNSAYTYYEPSDPRYADLALAKAYNSGDGRNVAAAMEQMMKEKPDLVVVRQLLAYAGDDYKGTPPDLPEEESEEPAEPEEPEENEESKESEEGESEEEQPKSRPAPRNTPRNLAAEAPDWEAAEKQRERQQKKRDRERNKTERSRAKKAAEEPSKKKK